MFYTYLWLREDGSVYYVGKGSGDRAFFRFERNQKPPTERNKILIQEHSSEADAVAAEVFFIAYYGRKDRGTGCLRNLTDGGDGVTNLSLEARAKISAKARGRKRSTDTCRKIGQSKVGNKNMLGKKHSAETIQKLRRSCSIATTKWWAGRALSSSPAAQYQRERRQRQKETA